jgi:hypothetical protein
MGYLQSKATGDAPSQIFDPVDPASVPLTGAWNEQMLNSTPLGDVTSVRNPDSAVARVVHALRRAFLAASSAAAHCRRALQLVPLAVLAERSAGELGADPATQAVASLLSGAAADLAADSARIAAPPPKA